MANKAVPLRLVHDADRDAAAAPEAPRDAQSSDSQPRVRVGGFETIIATRRDLAARMVEDCLTARAEPHRAPRLVFASNGAGIALAARDAAFAAAMARADMIHAAGLPVVQASRLLTRTPLPERIRPADFFHDAARIARTYRLRFYVVGADRDQTEAACAIAEDMHPGLMISGAHEAGEDLADDRAIERHIRQTAADVVWVDFGAPRQELWAVAMRERLHGVGWIKTCGGLCDALAGAPPRANEWMQTAALEWAHYALKTPTRVAARSIATGAVAFWRLATMTGEKRAS